ncbi:MAG TPA: class I SAM-dependent methyltransferase [Rhodanobacteraceae bacterium]
MRTDSAGFSVKAAASPGAAVPGAAGPWSAYKARYSSGEWRGPIFRDLILADARAMKQRPDKLTFLDIGCGGGFDGDIGLQQSLSEAADFYIGVEPDREIQLSDVFTDTHRCCFEDAPIPEESVDVAFAVMVLEHVKDPRAFWGKLHRVLRGGGCFWGLTVDARHWFVLMSALMEKLRLKDAYLDGLHGRRGEMRYENYPVCYRANTPRQIARLTTGFSAIDILNFRRVGQLDFYIPGRLRWLGHLLDSLAIAAGLPGPVMAVRVEK